MATIKDPCNGCVCKGCKLSEINGDLYGCKEKRCKTCDDQGHNIKLGYCMTVLELEQLEGEVMTIW